MEIRGFTVKYSKNQAKQRKSMESLLQKQINELYKKIQNTSQQQANDQWNSHCQILPKKHNAI